MRNAGYSSRNNPKPPSQKLEKFKRFIGSTRHIAGVMVLLTVTAYGYLRVVAPVAPVPPLATSPGTAPVVGPVKYDPSNYEGSGRSFEEVNAGILRMQTCKDDLTQFCDPSSIDFDASFECLDKVESSLSDLCKDALRDYWSERLFREGKGKVR